MAEDTMYFKFKGTCNKCWKPYEMTLPCYATVSACPNCMENIYVETEDE